MAAMGAPHCRQNFAPGVLGARQESQAMLIVMVFVQFLRRVRISESSIHAPCQPWPLDLAAVLDMGLLGSPFRVA